jgi:hypothetical protein
MFREVPLSGIIGVIPRSRREVVLEPGDDARLAGRW